MPKSTNEGKGIRIGLVASEFNFDVTLLMLERAKEEVDFLGAVLGPVVKTPGVFDIPLATKVLLEKRDVDAVVALGAVIEGETQHDEVVMNQAARKLADLSVEYRQAGRPRDLGTGRDPASGPGPDRERRERRPGGREDGPTACATFERPARARADP